MDSARPEPRARLTDAEIRSILGGTMLAVLLGALDQTIVATALPTIGRELHDLAGLPWVVTAYLLTATAAAPVYGKLADAVGRRRVLLIAIGLFVVGSIACALAPDMLWLILARGFQGLGGGGLVALGQTIIGDVVAPRERGRYQAFIAGVFMVSSFGGPVVGGFFAERLHWTLIFWINLPLGAVAFWLSNRVLRRLPQNHVPHRIDYAGALAMVAATVALLLALSWGGSAYPWTSPVILGLLAASLAAWVLFAIRIATAAEPFVGLDTLFNPVVRAGLGATSFGVGASIGLTIYLPIYFETVLGLSASQSGVALIALMGATLVGATVAGRLTAALTHYKRPATIGLAVAVAMTLVLAAWPVGLPFVAIEAILVALGLGLGAMFPVTTTAVQNAVPLSQLGTATGALNFLRSLGGAIMVAILGAIVFGDHSGQSQAAVAASLLGDAARDPAALASTFRWIFLTVAASLAASLACMVAMREVPLRGREPEPGAAPAGL